jgi:hypothetical protein
MRLNLKYLHNGYLGYGRYGLDLHDALVRQGVLVDTELNPQTENPAGVAAWVSTPNHAEGWFRGQRVIMNTMWEARTLPEQFRENLHNFDQLIVPCDHNVELFSRYHPHVSKVQLGIDPVRWQYRERVAPRDRFVFLIGGSGTRKGLDIAYKAFRRLWPNDHSWPRDMPRPHLIFKSPRGTDWIAPRMEQVTGHLSEQGEVDLYAMAHCYLQPSRGEGFGLQPLQAIAQGCPTILTDASGQAEFAYLGYGISAGESKADYFIHGDAGTWWEPSLDELCDRMDWVYHHYEEACRFATQASDVARHRFTWDACARQFIDAVGREHLNTPYWGDREWVTPELRRYPVRVTKTWRAEVCGTVHLFTPGETTYETADVKRIMHEAGVLEPSCVVLDPTGPVTAEESGLAPEQIAALGARSAAENHCTTCGQMLNAGTRWEPEPA